MKKILMGAALLVGIAFSTTSCGGGSNDRVNNDTIVSRALTDSLSRALGAFMGANLQDEVRYSNNIDDYIEGYQLVTAQNISLEKYKGMRAGLFAAEQFINMDAQGIAVNRDLFLQEFRKYIQALDLPQVEYAYLYARFEDALKTLDEILQKRELLRAGGIAEEAAAINDPLDEILVDESEVVVDDDGTVVAVGGESLTEEIGATSL